MPAPKNPQDHQKPEAKPTVEPVEGGRKVTHMGVTVTILDESFNDFEFLRSMRRQEDATRSDGDRMFAMIDAFDRLFGDDADRVLAALRVGWRVPLTAAASFVRDILLAVNPNS